MLLVLAQHRNLGASAHPFAWKNVLIISLGKKFVKRKFVRKKRKECGGWFWMVVHGSGQHQPLRILKYTNKTEITKILKIGQL